MCTMPEIRLALVANQICGSAFLVSELALGCRCGDVRGRRGRRRRRCVRQMRSHIDPGTTMGTVLRLWACALDVQLMSLRSPRRAALASQWKIRSGCTFTACNCPPGAITGACMRVSEQNTSDHMHVAGGPRVEVPTRSGDCPFYLEPFN